MAEYKIIDEEGWNAIPPKLSRKPDELDSVIDELEHGNIIRLTAADEKDLRGKRLTIGRRATKRGFKVEIRTQGLTIAVRKREARTGEGESFFPPDAPDVPAPALKKRGRKPRAGAEAGIHTSLPSAEQSAAPQ